MITAGMYDNVNDAFVGLCKTAADEWPIEIRRGDVKMMDSPGPICIEIVNPKDRILNVPGRNNSLSAACAETLWILAGRNDVDWLKFYLPRAPDFSDDGKVWRAGYGPRLRKFSDDGVFRVDQLKFVVNELKALPNSRRAVISLLDPTEDSLTAPVTFKDFPCNLILSFMVRGGHLDLLVCCRSQDLIWGASGINWFEFTVIQELVANMIGVPVGLYQHVTNNLHVYDRHFSMVKRIAEAPYKGFTPLSLEWTMPEYRHAKSLGEVDSILKVFFAVEEDIRKGKIDDVKSLHEYAFFVEYNNTLLEDLAMVTLAYCAHQCSPNLEHDLQDKIVDTKMLESYDRYIKWLDRPK